MSVNSRSFARSLVLAAAILATTDPELAEKIKAFRAAQSASVAERPS